MKAKEFLQDTLDVDHGLLKTFFALLVNPKEVTDHPTLFTKPWK